MSSDRVREIRLQTAHDLEARGHVDKAVELYVKAGSPGDAARLLVSKERYLEAGKVMLEALGVPPDDVGMLEGRMRAAAEKTARCFELGGDGEMASRLRRSLGIEAMARQAGRPSMAPDVLPQSEPRPSLPPAPSSGPRVSVPAPSTSESLPPASESPSAAGSTMAPRAPTIAPRHTTPAPRAPTPAPPASMPATPASMPATPAPSSAGTSSPSALAADEKWGRASGWKTGAAGGGDAIDLAIEQLLAKGKKSSAARVAWDAGRLEDAARWFAESGQDYETGAVLYDLGRLDDAMESLLRVAPDSKRHRAACVKLVDVASRLGRFDFELDRVLTQFSKAPPLEATEVATYLTLGELYARNGFHDGARRVLEQVLLHDAEHEGARAALAALPPPVDARRALSEAPRHASARPLAAPGSRALPALPSLEEFLAEARRHAPKKVAKGTSP